MSGKHKSVKKKKAGQGDALAERVTALEWEVHEIKAVMRVGGEDSLILVEPGLETAS